MGAYNVKVIQYPNGTTQVKKYSAPMLRKQLANLGEQFTFQQESMLSDSDNGEFKFEDGSYYKDGVLYKKGIKYIVNPFTNQIVSNGKFNTSPNTKESDIWHSVNRSKRKIYEYARCVNWEWFITFTFSPEKVDRYNFEECSRIIRKWLNNQRRNAPELYYLVVPEMHKDGAWHFHGLLANTGNMKFIDSGKTKKGHKIYNMSKWSLGFTTATAVDDIYKVSTYIGKYITKELCEATSGKQRYYVSQNLPKPIESTFLIDGVRELTDDELSQYNNIEEIYKNKLSENISTQEKEIVRIMCEEEKSNFLKNIFAEEESIQFGDFVSSLCNSLGCSVVHVSSPRIENSFVDVDYLELHKIHDI